MCVWDKAPLIIKRSQSRNCPETRTHAPNSDICWSHKFFVNAQLFTLGTALVASACLWSLCSVNSGVTLRWVPNCVTALTFTHQSWAPNWYSPSLINALHCKSLTALRSLFILLCHSAHQKSRSDMSVMAHLNGGTLMTACVAFPPFKSPRREAVGEKTLLAQLCIIKSWKHSTRLGL